MGLISPSNALKEKSEQVKNVMIIKANKVELHKNKFLCWVSIIIFKFLQWKCDF